MSALSKPDHPVANALKQYLREQIERGDQFFKSRDVASETEFTPSEIGAAFGKLEAESDELDIERWAYTNGTTWRVTQSE
ncbi:hypothetical protein SAMN05216388_10508 [Halorientalis persicus]|jgi:hypothetical protein|uniref:DUF7123 domain-containing protein n=1 Tax=Halorientalis persicus TaxID=1367881 RepID=A0A1H8W718_9EURY|nr:hypothetical protein [Halorientalis persicus]SEP23333.1 hypothetical protein SAMN05216388_10508 [Halorientalis persicus]